MIRRRIARSRGRRRGIAWALAVLSAAAHGFGPAPLLGAPQAAAGGNVAPARPASSAGTAAERARARTVTENGVTATLDVRRADGGAGPPRAPGEVTVSLEIRDARTGGPIRAAYPAAWIDLRRNEAATPSRACSEKVSGYMRGMLKARPEVDLNSYYLLAMTRTPQIAVIDPLLGFGRSKLYTTILLPGPGADWALSPDGRVLYVSVPSAGKVSVVDTETWKVIENVESGAAPTRLRLQPDGRRLWVANDSPGEGGGVTAIDTGTRSVVARIPTGGAHALEFAGDGRLFVTNPEAGTVSVIDTNTLRKVADIRTGERPIDAAYSPVLGSIFVIHEGDGAIVALAARTLEMVGRDELEPGLGGIRLIPAGEAGHGHGGHGGNPLAGRVAFITNPREDLVHVYDVDAGRLLRTLPANDRPEKIGFSSSFAYVWSAGSPEVMMMPLSDPTSGGLGSLDRFLAGAAVPAPDGGASPTEAVIPAPDMMDAVFVVNPSEKAVYYFHYMEGMPIPSGSLSTYGFEPTGIMLVSRTLRETEPGVYRANVKLEKAGEYDLVLLLQDPRVVHCFPFAVAENANVGGHRVALRLRALDGTAFRAGEVKLRFRLYDAFTGEAQEGAGDLFFQLASTSGWTERVRARPLGDGVYELRASVPAAGVYYLSFGVPSRGVTVRDRPPLILRATGDARTAG